MPRKKTIPRYNMIDLKLSKREEDLIRTIYHLEDALQVCMDALTMISPGDMPSVEQGVVADAAKNEAKSILEELKNGN
jgi:hypothetical protein